jgi:ApbE superfamily uncharacterized protein (UPF0280 family)
MLYIQRKYRNRIPRGDLQGYQVKYKDSDLMVLTEEQFSDIAYASLVRTRDVIEDYAGKNKTFIESMLPLEIDKNAPGIINDMIKHSSDCGVGPMAAVAGAIATEVGRSLMPYSREVIIENGGDVFLKIDREKTVGIFAADSPFSMKIGIRLQPSEKPFGLCTSSGTVGHSVSYGNTDAAVCFSDDCMLADAAATAVGNKVIKYEDIEAGLELYRTIPGLRGCLIIIGDKLAVDGEIEICKLK